MKPAPLGWFIGFSYRQFVMPNGFVEHIRFIIGLPKALYKFWRAYQ